jgi:hypothetical protein
MPEIWSSPQEDHLPTPSSPEEKKFNFGPRVARTKAAPQASIEPSSSAPRVDVESGKLLEKETPSRLAANYLTSISLTARENTPFNHQSDTLVLRQRISDLEVERDELRKRVEVLENEGTLDNMVIEMELETLRDEVARLRSSNPVEAGSGGLRAKIIELESLVSNLRRDKSAIESKYLAVRNADQVRIRTLEEQVVNERRMRDRVTATESNLPVVSIPASGPALIVRPRVAPAPETVPVFTAERAEQKPKDTPKPVEKRQSIRPIDPTVPVVYTSDLGEDELACQWKKLIREKTADISSVIVRDASPGSVNFKFGSKPVSCKRVGNVVMVQSGNERMVLERFIETYWPVEFPPLSPVAATALPTTAVTLKGLKSKTLK